MPSDKAVSVKVEDLIEVWKVLEILTVSFDKMGSYWPSYGEEAAKQALHEFIDPPLVQRIMRARGILVEPLPPEADLNRGMTALRTVSARS